MATKPDYDPTAHTVLGNGSVLYAHVLQKGWQAGSVVGLAVVLPVVGFRLRRSAKAAGHSLQLAEAAPALLRAQATSALAGVALSGIMCTAKVAGLEDRKGGLEDRAYRLFHNLGQHHVDNFAQAGSALGGAAAGLATGWGVWSVLGGASLGTFAGVVLHLLTWRPAEKEANKMLKEL